MLSLIKDDWNLLVLLGGGEEHLLGICCQPLASLGDLDLLVLSGDLEGSCDRDAEDLLDIGDLDLGLVGDLGILKLDLLGMGDLLFLPGKGDLLHILE